MIIGIVMIAIGLLLVLIEFFIPGGVIGVAGVIVMIAGLVFFALGSPSTWLTLGVIVLSLILLGVLIKFALYRIKHGKADASIYLRTDQAGYKASLFANEFIGQEGEVVADLKPAGHVMVGGRRLQAVSRAGYLEKGTRVLVIGGEGAHLIVKQKSR